MLASDMPPGYDGASEELSSSCCRNRSCVEIARLVKGKEHIKASVYLPLASAPDSVVSAVI